MKLPVDLADHLDLAASEAATLATDLDQARGEARVVKAATRTRLVRRARRLLARIEAMANAHSCAARRERAAENARKIMARAKQRRGTTQDDSKFGLPPDLLERGERPK